MKRVYRALLTVFHFSVRSQTVESVHFSILLKMYVQNPKLVNVWKIKHLVFISCWWPSLFVFGSQPEPQEHIVLVLLLKMADASEKATSHPVGLTAQH